MRAKHWKDKKKSSLYTKREMKRRRIKIQPLGKKRTISTTLKSIDKGKDTRKVSQEQITGWRLWLFRFVALTVIPPLFFLLLEMGLRIAGYGVPATFTIKCEVNDELYYGDNIKFSWRFFPRNIARECEPFIFAANKPNDTYRIFVFGASAAKGEPDGAFRFGRFLRIMLRQEYPGINFEIIPTAMAAINSHVVLEIAKNCAGHHADLFVVYLGNNEVVGPYGAGTVFAPLSSSLSLIRVGISLKALRLGQLLTNLFESTVAKNDALAVWRGLEMYLEKQIRADDPRLETVYHHFRRNLLDISRVARKRGAKIIFCTVGSNLKDSPPFACLHRAGLNEVEKKQWNDIYREGVANEEAGKYAEAVGRYLSACEIDDSYADIQFRLGRCYWALEQYDRARERYILARELDTLRFRADNRINEIIREVASGKAGKGVYLVEAEEVFEKNSPHETPGEELFYEHVHMNFTGTYLLAAAIFEQVDKILPGWIKERKTNEDLLLTEADCARYLAYTDWDRHQILDIILNGFIKKAPFTNQLYYENRLKLMIEELKALETKLSPDGLEEIAAQYRHAVENDSEDWCLHWKYGKLLAEDLEDYEEAAGEYRMVQDFLPHSYTGYNALGSVLRGLDDFDGAIVQYLKAIRIRPTCEDAHYYLGWIYQKQGKTNKAIKYYSKAMRLQPNRMPAYNNLAEILYRQGKIDKAVKIFRKGLVFVPNNPILHCNLGVLLDKQGHKDEAIKELSTALELDPNSVKIRNILNKILKESH